nr:ataxin-7-like [Ciona intestinalis]|eukprot:XP_002119640.1 ataxin-7-like [Ciona intestinalis]
MAAFDDTTGPELDLFAGHSWTDWQNAVESDTGAGGNDSSPDSVSTRQDKEVAKLKRQDLGLFGFCPAKDHFYVVVCSHCGSPVKPQAFNFHIEKHHKEKSKNPEFVKKPRIRSDNDVMVTTDTYRTSPSRHKLEKSEVFRDFDLKPHSVARLKSAPNQVKIPPVLVNSASVCGNTGHHVQRDKNHFKKNEDHHRFSSAKINRMKPDLVRKISDVDKRGHTNKLHKLAKKNHIVEQNPTRSFVDAAKVVSSNETLTAVANIKQGEKEERSLKIQFSVPEKVHLASPPHRQHKHKYNPQLDIVKTSDRGNTPNQAHNGATTNKVLPKPKKILPLKAREYDPDRHCGVWIADEQTNCTRSLTCKSHSRSIKRKVTGRRKTFDELVVDHARAKIRLKEKSSQQLNSLPTKTVDQRATKAESKISPNTHNAVGHLGGARAQSSITPPKSKSSFSLFPRSSTPRYIDCWEDSSFDPDATLPPHLSSQSQPPMPSTVCRFASRTLDSFHSPYNHNSDLQWRTFTSSFTQANFARQLLKQSRSNVTQGKTNFSFVPMNSASNHIQESNETNSNPCDCDVTSDIESIEQPHNKRCVSAPAPRTLKSYSADVTMRHKRTTSSAPNGNKTQPSDKVGASNGAERLQPPFEAPGKPRSTSLPTHEGKVPSPHITVTHFKKPAGNPLNEVIARSPKKKKTTMKQRKSLTRSYTQPTKLTNNHIHDNTNAHLSKEIIKRSKSTDVPSSLINETTEFQLQPPTSSINFVKKDPTSPMNGISTNVINYHPWPHKVTLSGAIGALRRNSAGKNEDIMKIHQKQGDITEIPRNHNNSNSYDLTKELTPVVDGESERSAHIDTLQSLLLDNTTPTSGILVEAADKTGVRENSEENSKRTNFCQIGELLSLLDQGNAESSSQDLASFSFRDSAIFEPSNLANS